MKEIKVKKEDYLNYYQIIGILICITIISIWSFHEGGMMPFYLLFAVFLFLPFAIVSIFSLLDIEKHQKTVQVAVWTGTFLLLAPSYSLPFFFEWGGVIIALITTGIGLYLWTKRKELEWQICLFNFFGSAIVTVVLISIIAASF